MIGTILVVPARGALVLDVLWEPVRLATFLIYFVALGNEADP
jgi:hypothetical protein